MCGRYASSRKPEDLVEEFEISATGGNRVEEALAPDYNVAPTKPVYAVVERPPRDAEPGDSEPGGPGRADARQRQLRTVRWGLVPFWAKDLSIGNRLVNARVETVHEKPAFRRAFAARRCLLPADGYYEWYPTEQRTSSGKPLKQPFFIRPADGGVLAMAGLYEIWRDPAKAEDDPDRFVWTCTVLTTSAEDAVGHIHDRMPLLVEPDRYAAWLDPTGSAVDDLRDLLVPAAPGRLEAYPVSTRVNNVRNNGPELLEPLEAVETPEPADAQTGQGPAL
jgi:putative SOS response-associated peptidase YedK